MATKKRPMDYLRKFKDVVDQIKPVDINTTAEYENQRKEEVDKVKESSQVSDDYMSTRFTARRDHN
jgi:hypothetical protein